MRTVAVTQNITVDGSIEFLGDWFDPTADQSDQLELLHEQSAQSDALLVGRKTFGDFRSYSQGGGRLSYRAYSSRPTTQRGAIWARRPRPLIRGTRPRPTPRPAGVAT
jgi:hypothetical protein